MGEPEEADPNEQLLLVEKGEELQSRELAELIAAESATPRWARQTPLVLF